MRGLIAPARLTYAAGLGALVLAWVAQVSLAQRPEASAWLYAAAAVVLLAAFGRDRLSNDARPTEPAQSRGAAFPLGRLLGTAAIAILLAVVATVVLARNIRSAVGLSLWVASLAVLVAGSRVGPDPAAALLPEHPDDAHDRGRPRPRALLEAFLVVALLVVAAGLRLNDLETHPGIHGDEGEQGVAAREVAEGLGPGIFGYSWWSLPALYFYCLSPFVRLFGETMVAIRLFSVLSGVVAVFCVYRLGRRLWGVRAGILAGGFLATSPLALEFSRVAVVSTATGTLWAAGFLLLSSGLAARRTVGWAAAGVCFGLSFYFYPAGRLIVVAIGCLLFYCVVRRKWRLLPGWSLLLLALAITLVPQQLASRSDDWSAFLGRAMETSIHSPHNREQVFARHGVALGDEPPQTSFLDSLRARPLDWLRVGLGQARVTAEVFYRSPDPTYFYSVTAHGGTLLSPLLAALTVLGVVWSVTRLHDARHALVLIWLIAGVLPAAITTDTPSVQRLAAAWPVTMLFPAALLDRVVGSVWPASPRLARLGGSIACGLVLLVIGDAGRREYFDHYRARCPHCDGTAQARYVQSLGQQYRAYVLGVGETDVFFDHGSTRYLAPYVAGDDVMVPSEVLPLVGSASKGAAFLLYPHNLQYLPLMRLFYPGGRREEIALQDGVVRFIGYRVESEEIAAERRLEAVYLGADGARLERLESDLNASTWTPPGGLVYPVKASWSGALLAPRYGIYDFAVDAGTTELAIDGQPVTGGSEIVLARGLHDLRIEALLQNAQEGPGVSWARAGAIPKPLAGSALYRRAMGGLSAEIWLGATHSLADLTALEDVAPTQRRVDPFVAFRSLTDVTGPQPLVARWRGSILPDSAGVTAFELRSGGSAKLLIDGRAVVELDAAGSRSESVELGDGPHAVELRYGWDHGRSELEWYWTPPGKVRELVPPAALIPAARSWHRGEVADPVVATAIDAAPEPVDRPRPATVLSARGRLAEPRGVGVDRLGRVFVGDTGNQRVVLLQGGKLAAAWGSPADEPGPGRFGMLSDVAVALDGTVATVDQETGDVTRFDADGSVELHLPQVSTSASGLAIDDGGRVWVADTGGSRILRIEPSGEISAEWKGAGGAFEPLEQPIDVVVDGQGVVYAVDLRHRIVRFDSEGRIDAQWEVEEGRERGGSHLASQGDRIVMTQPDRGQLIVLEPSTGDQRSIQAGGRMPVGIAAGPDGRVYVVDSVAGSVHVYDTLSLDAPDDG